MSEKQFSFPITTCKL